MLQTVTDEWCRLLAASRHELHLSRKALAERAHTSVDAIKAYELGLRHPTRERLTAILDALKVERGARNRILGAAGFRPDGLALAPGEPRGTFTRDEAAAVVRVARWPAFLLDEWTTVIEANESVQRVWGVDLSSEFTDPIDRNMLSIASNPRFADRCLNWAEAVGKVISVFKQKEWGAPEQLEAPSPAFEAALRRFLEGDPKYVNQLQTLWDQVPSTRWDGKIRWSYPIVWQDPVAGVMRFECLVTIASHAESINFNDWIPLDAQTWSALGSITA